MKNKIPILLITSMCISNFALCADVDDVSTAISLWSTQSITKCYKPNERPANVSEMTNLLNCALIKYCVPHTDTNCNPNELGTYDTAKDICVPHEGFIWDYEFRKGFLSVECPPGFYLEKYDGSDCPEDTGKQIEIYTKEIN